MIRNIDIKLNAAHPQLPILEATTFVGSPSAVMIHGVPPSVGAWRINAVRVVATYPDNAAHTVAAVLGAAGTWVATIPATETSGRVAQGLQIIADGTDERGESVTGYVLGIAGLAVYTRDMTIESAAGVKYYIHLLDDEPAEPKEGDAYLNGSTLVIYHDGEWTGIGGGSVELDNSVTLTSGNGVKSSGIWSAIWGALTALPTGFSSLYDWCVAQLAGKASTADATLTTIYDEYHDTPTFSEWVTDVELFPNIEWDDGNSCWKVYTSGGDWFIPQYGGHDYYATSLYDGAQVFTATRTRTDIIGYTLGDQTDKPLQPKGDYALLSDIAVKSVKLNGTALTPDANGAVNVPALPLKGGTMTGDLTARNLISQIRAVSISGAVSGAKFILQGASDEHYIQFAYQNSKYGLFVKNGANDAGTFYALADFAPLASPAFTGTPTAPTPKSGDDSTKIATTAFVKNAIGGITPGPDNTKLNSTAAGPNFQTGVAYAVGKHVTYNGVLYECVVAIADSSTTPDQDIYDDSTTPATGHWKVTDMTDPDAVLDITSQNQLRVVAKDGTLLWAQGYDLASTSSATLACDAVNNFTFADGATTQAFTLPTAPSGKVGDFILDIDNSANTGAATISFTDIANNTASVVIPKGENLNDMLAIAAGELARFYITLTTFHVDSVNKLPTWHIVKQVVENGGATV